MHPLSCCLIIALILGLTPVSSAFSPAGPREFSAKVIRIVDGDTFEVLDSDNRVSKIRMNGIDAPEKKQAYGTRSREAISALCFGKQIRVRVYSKDRNGRLIADTYLDNRSLSLIMVSEGMAWHFKKYSSDTELAQAELRARAARRGLWADPAPQAPWDYRRMRYPNR
jgi:micrococcal nuclease